MLLVNKNKEKLFRYSFILLCIASCSLYYKYGFYSRFPYFLQIILQTILLWFFYKSRKKTGRVLENTDIKIWNIYMMYMVCIFIYGGIEAQNYYEYRSLLGNCFTLLLPTCVFFFANRLYLAYTFRIWLKIALIIFIPLVFFTYSGAWGFYLAPLMLLGLFYPLLPQKWKWIVLFLIFIAAFADLGNRSNLIKFGMVLVLIGSYYYHVNNKFLLRIGRLVFITAPLLFLYLGWNGQFNVFQMDKYMSDYTVTNTYGNVEILTADTRTAIYVDVYATLTKYDRLLYGMSPARGYESDYGAYIVESIIKAQNTHGAINLRAERSGSEIGAINTLLWTGIIGLLILSMFYWRASYLAISKSNNIYVKTVGVFVAFRYCYWWVEDSNAFNIMGIANWMLIAVCLSRDFRIMTNNDMKNWMNQIFSKHANILVK